MADVAYMELTPEKVCDDVEAFTGDDSPGRAIAHVKAGYMRFMMGLDPRTNQMHTWSFTRPLATLSITQTSSATSTGVYSAANDETTVTATAAVFAEWMVGLTLAAATPGTLTIKSFTSTTIVVCDEGEAYAGEATTIPGDGIFDLPADYGGLLDPIIYPYASDKTLPLWVEATPEDVYRMWKLTNTQNDAWLWSTVPVIEDGTTTQSWQFIVGPRPDADRTLRYRYRRLPPEVFDTPTSYFLGGTDHSYTIRELALADAESITGHVGGIHEQKAQAMLIASIDVDRTVYQRQGPERLSRRNRYGNLTHRR